MTESWHIPRALSDKALRLLTRLSMEEIERRLRMDGPAEHERPTDEQLDDLFVEIDGSGETQSWRAFARAVLARWGAVNGEVAELAAEVRYLVRELRDQADDLSPSLELFELIHRAADLLERQALAEPGPETPTDKELLEMMTQSFRDDLAAVSRMAAHGAGPDITPGLFRVSLNTGALDFARAVLARWGAADGDLLPAEPPNIPSTMAMQYRSAWREGVEDGWNEARAFLARLSRPAVPPASLRQQALRAIPVTERLPGSEDCLPWPDEPDGTHWCWAFVKGSLDMDSWERRPVSCLTTYRTMHTHWLPAHALPLPELE